MSIPKIKIIAYNQILGMRNECINRIVKLLSENNLVMIALETFYSWISLLSGEIFSKQLLLINTQLVTRLIKFFD